MELTSFGVVWIILCILVLFLPLKHLISLLIFSCIFQAAAVMLVGGKGIGPTVFTEVFFVIRCVFNLKNDTHTFKIIFPKWLKWGFWFFIYSALASIFLPVLFAGVKVFPAQYGMDANFERGGYPLILTASNFLQILLLFFNISTLLLIYRLRYSVSNTFLANAFIYSVMFSIFIGLWGFISKTFGSVPFPSSFFYSNTSYGLSNDTIIDDRLRLTSTFVEASAAGQFYAAAFWAVFAQKKRGMKILSVAIFFALLLTLSGSGITAFLVGLILYLVLTGSKQIISVTSFIILGYCLLYVSGLSDTLTNMIGTKLASESGEVRTGADIFTYHLWLNTYLLGVGLGSHRTSSFLLNMLGAVGIIGSILFAIFYVKLITPILKARKKESYALFIACYTLTLMAAQILSAPDISSSIFWMMLFLAAAYKSYLNAPIGTLLTTNTIIKS